MREILLYCSLALAMPASSTGAAGPDYGQTANWVCRPGNEAVCTTGLDTLIVYADGRMETERMIPAANPVIDCFYVYPTVSRQKTAYSDLTITPVIQRAVNIEAGRFTSRCRVFAPLYRQATLLHLREKMAGDSVAESDVPLSDVRAAWVYYLEHDNRGRGVVLIGHSQGTMLLQKLIAERIDGTPVQALLVAAFLAGDPSLGVPHGKAVGGTFAHIPVCAAAAQTGCAYAWGSYLSSDDSSRRLFGRIRADGLESACVNPAAPSGGSGSLKFYYPKPSGAPDSDPPWIAHVGSLSGVCRADSAGNNFRVTIEPGPFAEELTQVLGESRLPPGWGIHSRDISLVQGNMLDVLDAEIGAWRAKH